MDCREANFTPRHLSDAQNEAARRVHCDCADLIGVGVYLFLPMLTICCATNFTTNIALHSESNYYLQLPAL